MGIGKGTVKGVVVLGAGVVFIIGMLFVAKPKVTITIVDESHDPVRTLVAINEEELSPQGQEGKTYTSSLSYGNNALQVRGPFTKDFLTEVSATPFKNAQITVTLEEKTPGEIIAETIVGEKIEFSNLRVFKNAACIVAYIVADGTVASDSYPSLLLYNFRTRTWEEVSSKYVESRAAYTIPVEVSDYFSELSSD